MTPSRTLLSKALLAAVCCVAFVPRTARGSDGAAFDIDRFGFDYWAEAQGLPQASVRTFIQDRDGFLWIGTTGGLLRFDGVTFERHGVAKLKDNEIRSIVQDAQGRLWMGTFGGGIAVYDRGRFSSLTTAEGLPDNVVRRLAIDAHGHIWAATDKGLVRISNGRLEAQAVPDAPPRSAILDLCITPDGTLFVATRRALHRFTGQRIEVVPGVASADDANIFTLTSDRAGAVWVGFDSGAVKRYHEGVTRRLREPRGSDTVYSIYEDPEGALWVASQIGAARLGPQGFEAVEPRRGAFSLSPARAFLNDREGNLWIASEKGLARMRPRPFTTVSTDEGLPDDSVRAILEDDSGTVWIGTYTGLSRWRDGRLESVAMDGKAVPAASLARGRSGEVWIASGRQLLVHRDGRTAPAPRWQTPASAIRVLATDDQGRLWVGMDSDGLRIFDGGAVRVLRAEDGLCSNAVRHVAPDGAGGAWIATLGGGVCHYRDGRFTSLPEMQTIGLSHGLQTLVDGEGVLWIATRGGLLRIKDGRQARITEDHGLLSSFLYSIVDDGQGRFWFACALGLFSVSKAELRAVADGAASRVTPVAYGIKDGMKSNVCTVAVQPSAARTRDGRLLFATLGGMAVVHLDRMRADPLPPPVALTGVEIDGTAFDPKVGAEAPPGAGEVEIRYADLSYQAPEDVAFRYRLDGIDRDWVAAGRRRFAHYANLPAGEYVFRVTAAKRNGQWSSEAATFRFRLQPHFYETWAFRVVIAVAALGAVLGLIQVHAWRARRREEDLRHRVSEAVAQVKVLKGMLPICSACKKIRDDQGYWANLETYISAHTEADFSHGVCPECVVELYPEYARKVAGARRASGGPGPAAPPPEPEPLSGS